MSSGLQHCCPLIGQVDSEEPNIYIYCILCNHVHAIFYVCEFYIINEVTYVCVCVCVCVCGCIYYQTQLEIIVWSFHLFLLAKESHVSDSYVACYV